MIFQHTWRQVLAGTKTQTRRIVKPGETLYCGDIYPKSSMGTAWNSGANAAEYTAVGSARYKRGHTYAVQPGRGQKSVGRIRVTAIRQERVQDITEADALAEGIEVECPACGGSGTVCFEDEDGYGQAPCGECNNSGLYMSPVEAYAALWDTIHTKRGERWADNPLVWVLEFELVEAV